jgi:hypothetical protein
MSNVSGRRVSYVDTSFAEDEEFTKALVDANKNAAGGFRAVLDELRRELGIDPLDALIADCRGAGFGEVSKGFLTELDQMVADATAPAKATARPILIRARDIPGRAASIVAKAFNALRYDSSLTPAARGEIMLRLGDIADRVFAKAEHPTIDKLDRAQAALDRALGDGHADDAEDVIQHAMQLINSGKLTPADHSRITVLLNEARSRLRRITDAEEK